MTIVRKKRRLVRQIDNQAWCINVAVGNDHRSEKATRLIVRDIAGLAEWMERHPSTADGGAHIIPAPMREQRRSAANAHAARIIGIDFDDLTPDAARSILKELAEFSALAYHTRKSTAEHPRLRVLVESEHEIEHGDYRAAHDALVRELADATGMGLKADPACNKSEQLLFTPVAGRKVEVFKGARFTPPEVEAEADDTDATPGFMATGKRNINVTAMFGWMRRHGATRAEMEAIGLALPGGLSKREISSIARSVAKYPVDGASRLLMRRLSDVQAEKIQPLWPGRFYRGKISLVFGDMGLGKSTLLFDIAARVTRGMPWPDGSGHIAPIGEVLILSTEDGASDTIKPRIEVANGNTDKVHVIDGVASAEGNGRNLFSLVTHIDLLDKALAEMDGRVQLVIIDPITGVFHGADSHKTAEVRDVLGGLAEVCEKHHVCFIGISHPNKAEGQKASYRMTGSLAFAAAPRSVFLVAKDEQSDGERIVMAQIKNNLAPPQPSLAFFVAQRIHPITGEVAGIEWMGTTPETATELMAPGPTPAQRATDAKADAARGWLERQLRQGPQPAADIHASAEHDGITRKYLDGAAETMVIKTKMSTGPWQWRLRTADDR